MVTSRRKLNDSADIGTENANGVRAFTVLSTDAGPNCICTDPLPVGYCTYLKSGSFSNIFYVNGNRTYMHSIVIIQVELGGYTPSHFCDPFVKNIFPKLKQVWMDSRTTTSITQNPRTPPPQVRAEASPEENSIEKRSPHVIEVEQGYFSINRQSWLNVVAKQNVLAAIEPDA